MAPLLAGEARLSLFEKRLRALDAILGGPEERRQVVLETEAVVERQAEPLHDRLLRVAQRHRRLLREHPRERLGGGLNLARRDHALDEPDPERLARVDARAGQDHLERLAATHQPGQALRAAAARDDREIHLGEAELGVLAGDPDVTGERQLEAAAEREATDRGDDRLATAVHRGAEIDSPAGAAGAGGDPGRHAITDVRAARGR